MSFLIHFPIFFLTFLGSVQAQYPEQSLNADDRKSIQQTLTQLLSIGYLSSPYPLGVYPGLRLNVGLVTSTSLGDFSGHKIDNFQISYVSFRKGLPLNVDTQIELFQSIGHRGNGFGVGFQWLAIESSTSPIFLITQFGIRGLSVMNQVIVHASRWDWVWGIQEKTYFLSTSFGLLYSETTYVGGPSGVVDTGETITMGRQWIRPSFTFGRRIGPDQSLNLEMSFLRSLQLAINWSYDF